MKNSNKYPRVSIIILNWNGWQDTVECLESLYQIRYPNYEVIVVDNYSSNNSIEMIKKWAKGMKKVTSPYFNYNSDNKPIKVFEYTKAELGNYIYFAGKEKMDDLPSNHKLFILKNDKNDGFAEGNNFVIRQIIKEKKSKYILLLNNDTVVDKKFLSYLVKVVTLNSKVMIVGPKIYYYDFFGKNNVIWFGGGYFKIWKYPSYFHRDDQIIDNLSNVSIQETDWVSGACILIKSNLFKKLDSVLNNNYYMGCEDVELAMRTKKLGYKSLFNPNSIIWHKVARSRKKIFLVQSLRGIYTNYKLVINNYGCLSLILLPVFTIELLYHYFNKYLNIIRSKKYL